MMDMAEGLARQHLLGRGFTDVSYEPDGNTPPDFLLDGRIAVEVRQLNQLEHHCSRGVDETGLPFRDRIDAVLAGYGTDSQTHWLGLRYRRPLPKRKDVIEGTRRFAEEILAGSVEIGTSRTVAENLVLQYVHLGVGPGDRIKVGTTWDGNLGGFVVGEFRRSLEHCVAEKSRKTAQFRVRYAEWWLLLVDRVGYGLSARDREQFFSLPALEHDWDRVVILSPLKPDNFFEIGPDGTPLTKA